VLPADALDLGRPSARVDRHREPALPERRDRGHHHRELDLGEVAIARRVLHPHPRDQPAWVDAQELPLVREREPAPQRHQLLAHRLLVRALGEPLLDVLVDVVERQLADVDRADQPQQVARLLPVHRRRPIGDVVAAAVEQVLQRLRYGVACFTFGLGCTRRSVGLPLGGPEDGSRGGSILLLGADVDALAVGTEEVPVGRRPAVLLVEPVTHGCVLLL